MGPSTPLKTKVLLATVSVLLISLLVANGIVLSRHKPLWNDEIYTQTHIIETAGYGKILSGRIPEGNNFPLFYMLQKTFLKMNAYRFPVTWDGEWEIYDPRSQFFLRILPNIFMSFSILAIFLYFWRTVGILAGLLALGLTLSSSAVWSYWAEARPYSLWFLLTTLQNLTLLRFRNDKEKNLSADVFSLSAIHILLCLTIPLGFVQALVASLAVVFLKIKKIRSFLPLAIIPLFFWIPYWLTKMSIKLYMTSPWRLILDNVPPEQWFIFAVYTIWGCWLCVKQRCITRKGEGRFEFSAFYLPHLLSPFLIAAAFLVYLFIANSDFTGFEVSSRYFIFLVPSALIMTVFIFLDLYALVQKDSWQKFNLILLGGGLIMAQSLNAVITILKSGIYH